jgi:MraZ protein
MFLGSFSNTLDDKGRVAIPVKFREALAAADEDRLMITSFEVSGIPCLEGYSARSWQELTSDLASKIGAFSQNRILFESVYIGNVQACQPDTQGRILLPQSLRRYAELERDVAFVGVGRKFRIFSAQGHAKVVDAFRAMLRENPDMFRDLGI